MKDSSMQKREPELHEQTPAAIRVAAKELPLPKMCQPHIINFALPHKRPKNLL